MYTQDQLRSLIAETANTKGGIFGKIDARITRNTEVPDKLAAIAMAESGGDPNPPVRTNSNGSHDYGLWQINDKAWSGNPAIKRIAGAQSFPDAMADPVKNAKAALIVYKEQGYTAWAAYNNGSYKKFLKGYASADSLGTVGNVIKGAAAAPVNAVADAFGKFLPVIGWSALGVVITILGVAILLMSTKTATAVTKAVAKV